MLVIGSGCLYRRTKAAAKMPMAANVAMPRTSTTATLTTLTLARSIPKTTTPNSRYRTVCPAASKMFHKEKPTASVGSETGELMSTSSVPIICSCRTPPPPPRRPRRARLPRHEDPNAVTDGGGFAELVGRDQHRPLLRLGEAFDHRLHAARGHRIQAARGLVQQQQR